MNFDARKMAARTVEQRGDSGLREEICGGNGRAGILVRGKSAREGVSDVGRRVDAFVKIVAEEMRAELKVEQVCGDRSHGAEEHYGHDGDENVSDDKTIAQAPEKALARPASESHDEIAEGGEKNKDEPSAEERDEAAEGSGPRENHKNNDSGGGAVERGGRSPEGAEAVKGWHG